MREFEHLRDGGVVGDSDSMPELISKSQSSSYNTHIDSHSVEVRSIIQE